MKVIYSQFNDKIKNTCTVHLKENKIYHVFGVILEPDRGVFYRIIKNYIEPGYATMALFPSTCFNVVSTIVPSNWGIKIYPSGVFAISPRSWLEDGFYETFYDSIESDEIYKVFERERDIVINEDPL